MSYGIISNAFVAKYKTNLELALQQMGSKLRPAVTFESLDSSEKTKVKSFVAPRTAQKVESRHQDVNYVDSQIDAAWIISNPFYDAQLLDKADLLRTNIDVQGPFIQAQAEAISRAQDDEIIAALFADRYTGKTGSDVTTFDSNQNVAVNVGAGSATGLNLDKLKAVSKMFRKNEVDLDREPIWMAISAEQHEDLLSVTQAVSLDYGTKPVLEDGRIKGFMGINFIITERLPVDANSYRRCFAWTKSGVCFGALQDLYTSVDDVPTKVKSASLKTVADFGATRLDEKRVVEIKCAE